MRFPCGWTCFLALVIVVSKIVMMVSVSRDAQIRQYESSLSPELRAVYIKISGERLRIYSQGYMLGLFLAFGVIAYMVYGGNKREFSTMSMVCMAVLISFCTSYFYYTLTPKTDWMLAHVKGKEETKAWLQYYIKMKNYYHASFLVGVVAVGVFAFAFRGQCA